MNYSYLINQYRIYEFYNRIGRKKEEYKFYKELLESYNINIKEEEKKLKQYQNRNYRYKKRLKLMLEKKCWFCTWTIEDNYMNLEHRRILKELYKDKEYLINIDFAPKTNRKHYHGIIQSEEEPKKWKYGFTKFIEIKINNETALIKYINKLSNHALKVNEKIIVSRRKNK